MLERPYSCCAIIVIVVVVVVFVVFGKFLLEESIVHSFIHQH